MAANTVTLGDPGASNDSSQGFAAGSTWRNLTSGAVWVCTSAAVGAAVWALAASAAPVTLATPGGGATGTLAAPLRSKGTEELDMLEQIRQELTTIRMILAEGLRVDLEPEG